MNQRQFGLVGIGSTVQLGKGGINLVSNNNSLELRNSANIELIPLKLGEPIDASHGATKGYVDTKFSHIPIPARFFNTLTLPDIGVVNLSFFSGGTYIRFTGNSDITLNLADAGQVDDEWRIRQLGTGAITVSGVSIINAPFGGTLTTSGPGAEIIIKCIIPGSEYDISGQVTSV